MRKLAWWQVFLNGFLLTSALYCLYLALNFWNPLFVIPFSKILSDILMIFATAALLVVPAAPFYFIHLFWPRRSNRTRFQLHLSTCSILMLASSILLGLNLSPRISGSSRDDIITRGWPTTMSYRQPIDENDIDAPTYTSDGGRSLAINSLCIVDILGVTIICCEWWIKRQSRRYRRRKIELQSNLNPRAG